MSTAISGGQGSRLHHRAKRRTLFAVNRIGTSLSFFNAQLINQPVKIAARYAQGSRAFRFAPTAFLQGSKNQTPLESTHFVLIRMAEVSALPPSGRPHVEVRASHRRRQAAHIDGLIVA